MDGDGKDLVTTSGAFLVPTQQPVQARPQLSQDPNLLSVAAALQPPTGDHDGSTQLATWLDQHAVGESKVFLKLLISNAAAGSIIGRGGSMVTTLQRDTRTRVQLSRSGEYFPGTMDRVLLIVGRRRNVLTALEAVLVKLMCEKVAPLHPHSTVKSGAGALLNLRMLVPAAVTACITDTNGMALSVFAQQTGADVLVMLDNLPCANIMYRQVVVIGTVTQQLKALTLLLGHLDSDPQYAMYCDTPPPMPQPPSSRVRSRGMGVGALPPAFVQQQLAGLASSQVPIANDHLRTSMVAASNTHGGLLGTLPLSSRSPPPMGASLSSLTVPTHSMLGGGGGGVHDGEMGVGGQFRMDITAEQAHVLLSGPGQQLIQYVQQTAMIAVQLLPAGIDGVSGPAIVLQGPRELAQVAQWLLLQGLMPVDMGTGAPAGLPPFG